MATSTILILDALKDLEIAVSELYISLAARYPDRNPNRFVALLQRLNNDDKNHAQRILDYLTKAKDVA